MLKYLKRFISPKFFLKFKSMNVIVSVCIFVILSFLLGMPIGQNKVSNSSKIYDNYNYDVLKEIPDDIIVNQVLEKLIDLECRVGDGIEFKCGKLEAVDLHQEQIEFESSGITKRVTFVFDLFDIPSVYLEEIKINYNPKEEFVLTNDGPYQVKENWEDYLIIFWSDALYFQAHPYGTNAANITHQGNLLRTETLKIFYQNNIPDFRLDDLEASGPSFGDYLLTQYDAGNANTLKLRAYTLAFLVGVIFPLIIVLVIWVFFRKSGKLKKVSEYYNIAAMVSIPIFIIFFILLWFVPKMINIFIFIYSFFYLLVIYSLNTREELV
ncbi:MAG: hypothetical protein PHX62_08200 [Bacilli bacterium]|nr:hypothetical protein [Bacilli bacterium]